MEAEHRRLRVALRRARDAFQLRPERRGHGRVGIGVECEFDVGGCDRLSILPPGSRVQMEDQRERAVPLPALGQQRLEVFVADGVRGHPHVGELEEKLLPDVPRDDVLRRRRQQGRRLRDRGVDERAAVFAGAAAAPLAAREHDDKKDDGGACEAP